MPERIQLQRAKGWRKPDGAIVVARPTRWGNPYRITDPTSRDSREAAVNRYRAAAAGWSPQVVAYVRQQLSGKNLACWCPPGQPCHADVLLEIANAEGTPS